MTEITRRTLVGTGLAVSGTALLPVSGATKDIANLPAPTLSDSTAAVAPRERLLFDDDWRFAFGNGQDPAKDFGFGFGQSDFSKTGTFKIATGDFDASAWRPLDLPHDWAVELPFVHDDSGNGDDQLRSHGYRPLGRRFPATSVGWYRREFDIPASDLGRRIRIDFDGVMRDSLVFVNGCFVGRSDSGYAPFGFDVSDFLNYGGKNYVVVRVDASFGDGWFYEGAGIYRHVWLTKLDPVHFGQWETLVRPVIEGGAARLALSTIVENQGREPANAALEWIVIGADGSEVARAQSPVQVVPADTSVPYQAQAVVAAPALWSTETPNLYSVVVKLVDGGRIRDAEQVQFGIRTAVFDAQKGFFLNGKPLKIQGTCNHQDHAGVGAALPDRLQSFRLSVLQGMGCNAVRTSHNIPTPEWVAACDRMGVMMMCETRQMSSNPSGMRELETMVKRYRNSPSIIIWSIGNEEWVLQEGKMAPEGARIARAMVDRCHELDPTRVVSAAVNGNNEQGVTDPLDIVGFNYNPQYPPRFHAEHPDRPIFGSETSSAVSTRGEYSTDQEKHTMNCYDGVVSWGTTPEQWWSQYGSEEYLAGGFAWTGFDYRGEPTPYGWPSNSSQFGITDLCGFPKDYYYYYKAWWGGAPSIHLFPHWNWPGREGQNVPVWVYSNVDEIELRLNGRSLGVKPMPRFKHVEWQVPYQPGVIEAVGRRGGRSVLVDRRETTGSPAKLRMNADRPAIDADGRDVAMITVDVLDARGRPVPTANDKLAFRVSGAGRLIGVGNGNPNSLESDKAPKRALFNGLAQLIVQSNGSPGDIRVEAFAEQPAAHPLVPASLVVRSRPALPAGARRRSRIG
jgi:beta-galactosidase